MLLVEDLDIVREDLKHLIDWEKEGYEIVGEARNGEVGLNKFRQLHPDIIITDIRMPVLSGLDMVRIIQEETPEGKIGFILLTAYKEFEYAQKAIQLGLNSYIIKYEVTAEGLLEELNRQSKMLQKVKNNRKINRVSLIRNFLKDPVAHEDALKEVLPKIATQKMLLMCSNNTIDAPDVDFFSIAADRIFDRIREQSMKGNSIFEVVLRPNLFLVFYQESNCQSLAQIHREKWNLICDYQKEFEKEGWKLFIVENDFPISFENFYEQYDRMLDMSKNSVFVHGGAVVNVKNHVENTVSRQQQQLAEQQVDEIKNAFADGKFEELSELMDQLLLNTLKQIGSYELFLRCVKDLAYIVGSYDHSSNKDSFRSVADNVLSNPQKYSVYEISSILRELIENLSQNEATKYSRKVREMIAYMEDHYQEDISLSIMAERLNLSIIYMCQLFKKEVGVTFKTYLTGIRIREAQRLLKSGKYKVYEVSNMVGYQTVQYFSKVFKQETGKYPSDLI